MANENPIPEPEKVSPTAETVPNISVPPWPPVQPQFQRREAAPLGMLIFLGVLALILVVSGLGFIIFATTTQYQKNVHTQATTAAQATIHTQSTIQAFGQATARGFGTANANIYASATATNGVGVTQTAVTNTVGATATADTNTFTSDTSSSATLTDPLTDNSNNNNWDTSNGAKASGCAFNNSTYHVIERQKGSFQPCLATATNFSDFLYEVQMTVDTGTQGGIVFRADGSQNSFYLFRIGIDGSYFLDLYKSATTSSTLLTGYSAAITPGLGQQNTVAVIAVQNTLDLYVNQQYVASVTDSSLSSGEIGVASYDNNVPTEIEFSNAQIWDLTGSATPTSTPTPTPAS
ncbi:MAG: family 16 glycoside hydrolase [Ktedonobacteraceae bacterium]